MDGPFWISGKPLGDSGWLLWVFFGHLGSLGEHLGLINTYFGVLDAHCPLGLSGSPFGFSNLWLASRGI